MQFNCKHCQKTNKIPDDKLRGKSTLSVRCAYCKQVNKLKISFPSLPEGEEEKTAVLDSNESRSSKEPDINYQSDNGIPSGVLFSSDGKSKTLEVGSNILGRKGGAGVSIAIENDQYVSRVHCKIEGREENGKVTYTISDDGSANNGKPSTNGTFVNEVRLSKYDVVYLSDNDQVRVGETTFTFRVHQLKTNQNHQQNPSNADDDEKTVIG